MSGLKKRVEFAQYLNFSDKFERCGLAGAVLVFVWNRKRYADAWQEDEAVDHLI
jgi:hypothetical protein